MGSDYSTPRRTLGQPHDPIPQYLDAREAADDQTAKEIIKEEKDQRSEEAKMKVMVKRPSNLS